MNKRLLLALTVSALPLVSFSCSSAQKKPEVPAAAAANKVDTAQADAVKMKAKAKAASESASQLSCKLNDDVRTAQITTKGTGCEVAYTKFGKSKQIASSAEGSKHCEDVVAGIKKHLLASGYTCQ